MGGRIIHSEVSLDFHYAGRQMKFAFANQNLTEEVARDATRIAAEKRAIQRLDGRRELACAFFHGNKILQAEPAATGRKRLGRCLMVWSRCSLRKCRRTSRV